MKIPVAKAVVDKELENWRNFVMERDKSQKEGRSDRWSNYVGRKRSFCIINGHMSLEKCWAGGKAPKVQRSGCSQKWNCTRRFRVLRSIHWTRIFSISNDSRQKSWISSPDCQVAMDKQQTQYQLIPKWKWKMLTNYWKFQNRNVQTFGFVNHDTNGLNHGPVWKTQSFLLNGICMVILGRTFVGKAIWETPIETWLGKTSKLGMSLCTTWKGIMLIFVCGWLQTWMERNKNLIRCGNYSTKKSIWDNQHLSWIMHTWDALNVNVK